jgi:hypothetical protein
MGTRVASLCQTNIDRSVDIHASQVHAAPGHRAPQAEGHRMQGLISNTLPSAGWTEGGV